MAVRAFRPERDHDVRLHATEMRGDGVLRGFGIDGIEAPIWITKGGDLADAERLRGRVQLGLARLADDVGTRTLGTVDESPALASRRGDEIRLDTFPRIFRQRPARPQRLI